LLLLAVYDKSLDFALDWLSNQGIVGEPGVVGEPEY
jgi:hypothetical protein